MAEATHTMDAVIHECGGGKLNVTRKQEVAYYQEITAKGAGSLNTQAIHLCVCVSGQVESYVKIKTVFSITY